LVSERAGGEYVPYKIMESNLITDDPSVIIPEGLSAARLEQLQYFNDYIPSEHHEFMSTNY